jgi:hypothetical protein
VQHLRAVVQAREQTSTEKGCLGVGCCIYIGTSRGFTFHTEGLGEYDSEIRSRAKRMQAELSGIVKLEKTSNSLGLCSTFLTRKSCISPSVQDDLLGQSI